MAKIGDEEGPKFDDLEGLLSPGGDAGLPDLGGVGGEGSLFDMPADLSAEAMSEPGAVATAAEEATPAEQPEPPSKKKRFALPPAKVCLAIVGILAVCVVLAFFGLLRFSTSLCLAGVGLIGYKLWLSRLMIDAYTVLLGCAAMCLAIALYCLWSELGQYHFQIKAKQRACVSSPAPATPRLDAGVALPMAARV